MIKKRFWLKAYLLTLALFAFFATLVAVVVLLEVKSQLAAQLLDAAQLEAVWNSVWVKTLVIGLLAFCCFALLLYIVLLSLSKPLEDLAFTEQRFAAGNYGIRAKYTGKDEIGRLARSFNHMAESVESSIHSLEENAELKQQLVDNLSHELRTPLTAINGYADYVWQAALDENEIYEQMEKIKNETQRLLRISNRMLEISALRDANRKQNKTPINPVRVRRLFTQVNSSLSPAAKIQGVTLQVDSPTGK